MTQEKKNDLYAQNKNSSSDTAVNRTQRRELAMYEQLLINYLLQKREAMNNVPGGLQRVRRLTLGINNRDPENPLYTVRIGMFEVSFNILTGAKDRGTLFGLERYIIDWYRRLDSVSKFEELARGMKKKEE